MSAKKKDINKNMSNDEFYNELVPVYLVKDNDRYKDDVLVTVNGYNYQIQRGKQVMVPRKVALVLEDSAKQESYAQSMIDRFSKRD